MAPQNTNNSIETKVNNDLSETCNILTAVHKQISTFITSNKWIDVMVKMNVLTEFVDNLSELSRLFNVDQLADVELAIKDYRPVDEMLRAALFKVQNCKGYLIESGTYEYSYLFRDIELRIEDLLTVFRNEESSEKVNNQKLTSFDELTSDYYYALDILDKYDNQQLEITHTTDHNIFSLHYRSAKQAIDELKGKFGSSALFGNEKDESFKGSISAIYQTFDGLELYPSVEEKGANLLYFIVKNHSFSDGNKRIAAFIFIWFLAENRLLYNANRSKRIADNTLVAMILLIAESRTEEKENMIMVVVNLINLKN